MRFHQHFASAVIIRLTMIFLTMIFRARSDWLQRRAESDGRIAHVRDALGMILGDSRARGGVGDADAIARARSAVSSF